MVSFNNMDESIKNHDNQVVMSEKTPSKYHYILPLLLQKMLFIIFYPIFRIFMGLEIKGRENLKGLKKPLILVANHTGEFDTIAVPMILGMFHPFWPIYFVSGSKELYKNSYNDFRKHLMGGFLFNIFGGYEIYPGQRSYAVSLRNHVNLLKSGRNICIYPEGRITRDGKISKDLRGGLGYLVFETRATVVPVAVNTFYNLSFGDLFSFKRKLILTVGKPISADELITKVNDEAEDFHAVSRRVMDIIEKLLLS